MIFDRLTRIGQGAKAVLPDPKDTVAVNTDGRVWMKTKNFAPFGSNDCMFGFVARSNHFIYEEYDADTDLMRAVEIRIRKENIREFIFGCEWQNRAGKDGGGVFVKTVSEDIPVRYRTVGRSDWVTPSLAAPKINPVRDFA